MRSCLFVDYAIAKVSICLKTLRMDRKSSTKTSLSMLGFYQIRGELSGLQCNSQSIFKKE